MAYSKSGIKIQLRLCWMLWTVEKAAMFSQRVRFFSLNTFLLLNTKVIISKQFLLLFFISGIKKSSEDVKHLSELNKMKKKKGNLYRRKYFFTTLLM